MKPIKILLLTAILLICNTGLFAQSEYDNYLQNAEKHLREGNCEKAESNYNVYKGMTGKTNADLQKRIDECKKPPTPEDDYKKGKDFYDKKDYTQAVVWFRKAAEQGYSNAQFYLGYCYYCGRGVSEDNTQAVVWFRKAAEQGYSDAQYHLGYCYYFGIGVSKDKTQAVVWFRKAAEQGHAEAQYTLGVFYYNGDGVSQDYTQAVVWYRKAAEQGHAGAKSSLKEKFGE